MLIFPIGKGIYFTQFTCFTQLNLIVLQSNHNIFGFISSFSHSIRFLYQEDRGQHYYAGVISNFKKRRKGNDRKKNGNSANHPSQTCHA